MREGRERNIRSPTVLYRFNTSADFTGRQQQHRHNRIGEEQGHDGWTLVTNRRRHNWAREERIRVDIINEKFINLYISNFPEDWTEEPLKKSLEKVVGQVFDISIPKKRAKDGKRFAFVRFYRVRDEEALTQRAKGVWIGLYKLLANKARFNKFEKLESRDGNRKIQIQGGNNQSKQRWAEQRGVTRMNQSVWRRRGDGEKQTEALVARIQNGEKLPAVPITQLQKQIEKTKEMKVGVTEGSGIAEVRDEKIRDGDVEK